MGKYEPLSRFLSHAGEDCISASFAQVEEILGCSLPMSAYRHQAWWANESNGTHTHSRSWQDAGWETRQVNTGARTVKFERRTAPRDRKHANARDVLAVRPADSLMQKAMAVSGIADEDKVIEAALTALIQREAGRMLIELGGTMPELVVPERERPTC